MKTTDFLNESFPRPYGRPNPYGTIGTDKPRIRKYTYERPDGSIATRYEVLDSQGRRVSGQGTEGFDTLEYAKDLLRKISENQVAPPEKQEVKPQQISVEQLRTAIQKLQKPEQDKILAFLKAELDKTFQVTKEGQIYSTGGGAGQAQRYYEPREVPNQTELQEDGIYENLHKWFKEKWVRFGPDGKIKGDCARGDDSEGKPKCLPQAKAHSLGKKGRASAAARKRREDPNPERSGKAINVATKKKTNEAGPIPVDDKGNRLDFTKSWVGDRSTEPKPLKTGDMYSTSKGVVTKTDTGIVHKARKSFTPKPKGIPDEQLDELKCWPGHHRVPGTKAGAPGSCAKNKNESVAEEKCPHCNGPMFEESMMNEKKDACYYKVKSRYKVWPSAYASGALVKCRKSHGKWGSGGKKDESIEENLGTPYPGTYEQETLPLRTKGQKRTPMIAFETTQLQLDEKWSEKYKKSINCSNPKGFSQKAHCQGRKKK